MAYREVTMVEVKEVLRQWLAGGKTKRIATLLGRDPKTVRTYIRAATAQGLRVGQPPEALTPDVVATVGLAVHEPSGRPRGEAWELCARQREHIEKWLGEGVRLTKVRKLLRRRGVEVAYGALRRFAMAELGFGADAPTVPVADGKPGHEVQVDTGWMTLLEPDERGRRRRFRAWIFTPVVSRYRFVYACSAESTETAIEACEAAWAFYGGVYRVMVPDNTKAIVQQADPLKPIFNATFLEYAQARGFVIDPARVRSPKDKARVERSVRDVRDDCFAGEVLRGLDGARERGLVWSRDEYGMARHSTTGRIPSEHFAAVERAALLPAPTTPADIVLWVEEAKVSPDQHAIVDGALYSLPEHFRGRTLRARADRSTVCFYVGKKLVKTHARKDKGERSSDPADFPPEKWACGQRDTAFFVQRAREHGEAVGRFAEALLDSPLPWTCMRHVHALLGLCKRYGAARVNETCAIALEVEMHDVLRLGRMLELAVTKAPAGAAPTPPPTEAAASKVIPLARYLREASEYAVPRAVEEGGAP